MTNVIIYNYMCKTVKEKYWVYKYELPEYWLHMYIVNQNTNGNIKKLYIL